MVPVFVALFCCSGPWAQSKSSCGFDKRVVQSEPQAEAWEQILIKGGVNILYKLIKLK